MASLLSILSPKKLSKNIIRLTKEKNKNQILPARAAVSQKRIENSINDSLLVEQGDAYVDDRWTSRAKKHFLVSLIFRPGIAANYDVTHRIDCEEIHGVDSARFWGRFILMSSKNVFQDDSMQFHHLKNSFLSFR